MEVARQRPGPLAEDCGVEFISHAHTLSFKAPMCDCHCCDHQHKPTLKMEKQGSDRPGWLPKGEYQLLPAQVTQSAGPFPGALLCETWALCRSRLLPPLGHPSVYSTPWGSLPFREKVLGGKNTGEGHIPCLPSILRICGHEPSQQKPTSWRTLHGTPGT